MLRDFIATHAAWLKGLLGGALLLLLGWWWLGEPFGRAQTLGTIWVDSPEIYTRERLVNDRFIQDAWLSQQLASSREIVESLQLQDDRRVAQLRAAPGGAAAASAAGAGAGAVAGAIDNAPRGSSRDRLLAEIDYRELLRNLAAENQLDDRHDLNGNSLYRFKFDASVLPGHNTQATAVISVNLKGSTSAPRALPASAAIDASRTALSELGNRSDVERWRAVYRRWIESLRSRLNQTHKELKQGYTSNEFAHNDYVRLVVFLERNLHLAVAVIPTCPAALISMRDQGTEPARLSAEQHAQRKRCVQSLIDKHLEKRGAATAAGGVAASGRYIVQGAQLEPNSLPGIGPGQAADDPTQRAAQELDSWLNAFFASKSVQLVLGIAVPDFAFVGMGFYDVNTLEQLIRLSFFGSQTTSDDGNVFTVTQKILTVMALDPARVAKARYAELAARVRELGGDAFEDFVAIDSVPKDKLLVSRTGLRNISGEGYQLNAADFKPLPGADGMYIAAAELGLLNFVRKASNKVQAFTYAVTPKESADNVSTQLSSDARVDAGALLAPANAPSLNMSRESSARALTRRNSVVGFGSVSSSDSAGFGWTIGARVPQLDGPRLSYVHGAGQYSLSALVSIPSWWNEVVLEVTTRWVGRDGKLLDGTGERITYKVDVPTDFEPLEASLLEVQQLGPELMESRLDPVALTACRPGAIVIPGRRLWRSTRVTLGYQTADEISVLPNMKGIVASFNSVRNQMTLAEAAAVRDSKPPRVMEIQRPVRVWTSQGTITLPNLATIGIPERCDVPEAARPAGK